MESTLADVAISEFEGDISLYWRRHHHCCDVMQGDTGPFIRVNIYIHAKPDMTKVFEGTLQDQLKGAIGLLMDHIREKDTDHK